jgi:HlyD family secretion protein
MRRVLIGAGILLAIIAVVVALNWNQITAAGTPALVITDSTTVERGSIAATVNATGNVEANQQINLNFDTPGRVAEVLVEEGATVTSGQVLAKLDTKDLEFAIAQAEANVEAQQARLDQLQNPGSEESIAAAEAQLVSAQASLERLKAGTDVTAARAALESAQANLNQLYATRQSEIDAARAQLEAAQAALATLEAGPDSAQLVTATAELERARANLQRAQAAYDLVRDRPDIGALPQSSDLQSATINYEVAQANYDNVVAGATPEQLAQARSSVATAQANLDRVLSSAAITSAEAQVTQAQANLDRLLSGDGTIDISAAEAQVAQAENTLRQLQEGVSEEEIAAAEATLHQAEIQLEQAQNNLTNGELRAPFDGVVGRLGAKAGEIISAGTPMVTLVDLTAFRIEVEVDEVDIGQVKVGDPVTVFVDSLPDAAIPGEIEFIAPVPTALDGVVSYPVRIIMDASDAPGLRAGMTANVDITTEVREDTLLIPNRMVIIDRTTGQLFAERQNLTGVEQIEITVGLRNEELSEITSGLAEGDTVVIRRSEDPLDAFQN